MRSGIGLDFSKGVLGDGVAEFFTENGVLSMFEAKKYDHVESVSTGFGEIVDACYRNFSDEPVTDICTKYLEAIHITKKQDYQPGLTETELEQPQGKASLFKSCAKAVFGFDWASGMAPWKWHALDHAVEALWQVEGIVYQDEGLYDGSHKEFKKRHNEY